MAAAFLASCRRLSTAAATISASSAKSKKLQKVFDPVAVLSSSSSLPADSAHSAVKLAVRRLVGLRRFDDIDSLLQSHCLLSNQDEPLLSTLILAYATANMTPKAHQLFDEIPQPTATSFNAILRAHIEAKTPNQIPQLFAQLPAKHSSIVPDELSYRILIKSFCLCNEVDKAFEAFNEMKVKNIEPNMTVYTKLVASCYKTNRPGEAAKLWEEMVGRGIKPDLTAYHVKVVYAATNGNPDEVLKVMKEMMANGLEPDASTYNYLTTCYCKYGMFKHAKRVYMKFLKKPSAMVFKMLVRSFCSHGDFDGGLEVAWDSIKRDRIPDFNTMKVLVEGLVKIGKVWEAKEVVDVIKERFPHDSLSRWIELERQLGLSEWGRQADSRVCLNLRV